MKTLTPRERAVRALWRFDFGMLVSITIALACLIYEVMR